MTRLTKQQAQVLAFIQARMPCVWRALGHREISVYHGVAVQPNHQHAWRLERRAALPTARIHRNIRLRLEHRPPACLSIIGDVAAGASTLAVENLEGSMEIDCPFGDRTNPFILCVTGDNRVGR
jgi:SOS-response transcriptional repressor LexA